MLKKLLIIAVIITTLPFIVAIFVDKNYEVEREVVINQSKDDVFQYLKYLKNQDEFSKWAKIDPLMTKAFRGTDGTVGFVSAWQSDDDEVGTGEQEIIAIIEGERIDFELRFLKPFQSTSPAYMITESITDTSTKVKWGFSGHLDYPMNLMLVFIDFEQMIGDDLQTGLDNLKKLHEQQ